MKQLLLILFISIISCLSGLCLASDAQNSATKKTAFVIEALDYPIWPRSMKLELSSSQAEDIAQGHASLHCKVNYDFQNKSYTFEYLVQKEYFENTPQIILSKTTQGMSTKTSQFFKSLGQISLAYFPDNGGSLFSFKNLAFFNDGREDDVNYGLMYQVQLQNSFDEKVLNKVQCLMQLI